MIPRIMPIRSTSTAFLFVALALATPARADNYTATAGSGLTFAAKNIGGVLYPWWIPANSSGTELFTSGNAAYVQFPAPPAVVGPTAVGSPTANPPVPVGGSADGTATGNVNIWKVGTGGIGYITGNLTQGGSALSATNGLYANLLQGNAALSLTNPLFVTPATSASWAVTGTFYQATQPVSIASGQVASGAIASGAVASGAYASGSLASGAMVDLVAAQTPVAPNTATATKGLLAGGTYTSTQPTLTTTQQAALAFTSRNAVIVAPGADNFAVQASVASGGIASGAVASGAYASGAFAVGAGADGWDVTEGAKADAACATSTGTCSLEALLKYNNEQASTIATNTGAAVPPGTNTIGFTSTDPCAQLTKKNIAFSTGSTGTQLISGTTNKNTYICSLSVIASAAANFSLVAGSGSSVCTGGTPIALIGSTTAASGMALPANGGITLGSGAGSIANDVAAVAQSYNICIGINGSATLAGNLTYVQQ